MPGCEGHGAAGGRLALRAGSRPGAGEVDASLLPLLGPGVDTLRANSARVYDYWLGGTHSFPADLGLALARWRERVAEAATGTERKSFSRGAARRIVRTGFTLVMPRWHGWTSDLDTSAQVFGHYYPGRAGQMRAAAATARTPTPIPPCSAC